MLKLRPPRECKIFIRNWDNRPSVEWMGRQMRTSSPAQTAHSAQWLSSRVYHRYGHAFSMEIILLSPHIHLKCRAWGPVIRIYENSGDLRASCLIHESWLVNQSPGPIHQPLAKTYLGARYKCTIRHDSMNIPNRNSICVSHVNFQKRICFFTCETHVPRPCVSHVNLSHKFVF